MSRCGKIFFLVGRNFELFLKLSIPPFDQHKWNQIHAVLFPIFGSLLIFIQIRMFDTTTLLITLGISLIFSGLIYYSTEKRKAPNYLIIFMFIAFIQSVQWMWFLCNVSVDIFKLFVELSDIEPTYVGLTFMACANSVCDIVSDSTMARKGYSVMAITAAFAGPIFKESLSLTIGEVVLRDSFYFCDLLPVDGS